MPPRTLTVLAAIRAGEEDALRAVLRPIGDDVNGSRMPPGGRPNIAFPRSDRIHFARLAILSDPDRGPRRRRLLYASVFDGSLDEHLAEIVSLTTDLDAIWGCCEGYSGAGGFAAFMKARAHEPAALYIAFRDETVASIRRATESRRARDRASDAGVPDPPTPQVGAIHTLRTTLARIIRALPLLFDVVVAVARHGIANVYHGTLKVLASLDRYTAFRLVNRVTRNRLPPMQSPFSCATLDTCGRPPLAPGDAFPSEAEPDFREDVVTQNQLTLVTVIQPGAVNRVGAVMSAIDSYARRLSPEGSLTGVSTIHFVRWIVIDEGKRLVMVSDYDGSWENYIDEFAEMILSGLDAIWETAFGYPPDGARDLPAFKQFLRGHQVPAEVFFSAYPDQTVLNILQDTGAASR